MKKNYINNKYFYDLLVQFKQNKNDTKLKNEIALCLIEISNRLITSGKFYQYPEDMKEEMVQDSICHMYRKLHVFNVDRGDNPFSFFTGIAFNVFRNHLNKFKKRINNFVSINALDNNSHILIENEKDRILFDANKINTSEIKK